VTARSLNEAELASVSPEDMAALRARGEQVKHRVVEAIKDARLNSARTQQAVQRRLGMSDLGGCREFIRATIAGEPRKVWDELKWSAEVGTAVGEHVEKILAQAGWSVQDEVVLRLPQTGIQVTGHLDEMDLESGDLVDNKTVDGVEEIKRSGPSDKYAVQLSGYLVAAIQTGILAPDAMAHLMFFDRSGKTSEPYVWTINLAMAESILEWAEERLKDVQHALATGTREDRTGHLMTDEPESFCYAIGCPFYDRCWSGYNPTGEIEHPRQLDAVRRRIEARAEAASAQERLDQAKEDLRGVEGIVQAGPYKGTMVKWTLSDRDGRISDTLNVREPKKEKTE
jgi:hypothetical protein